MLLRLVNTKNINLKSSIKNAILNPSVSENGMWSFLHTTRMSKEFFSNLPNKSFNEIAYDISDNFNLTDELGKNKMKEIINNSFNFPINNNKISKNLTVCELYHGPSKSFKDIGAKFTANIIEEINNNKLNIVTATTGDTGAAVAHAFYKKKNIKVHILYPKNKISVIQRKQITTLGSNIKCYEVEGNFDDCQLIVNKLLKEKKNITTCNSVNIARIIAQTIYYFYTCREHLDKKINISIPTGNLGNGLSCYLSKRMGLPINDIIFACNKNSDLKNLLNYNDNKKINSIKTLSNAIDIINPSNYDRLNNFINNYDKDSKINLDYLITTETDDKEILQIINELYYKLGIIIDPHTAVAFDGLLKKYSKYNKFNLDYHNIIMSTADPIKFYNEIDYSDKLVLTNDIKVLLEKKEHIIKCKNDYDYISKYIN